MILITKDVPNMLDTKVKRPGPEWQLATQDRAFAFI